VNAIALPSRRVVLAVALLLLIMVCGIAVMQLWPNAVLAPTNRIIAMVRSLGGIGLIGFALLQAFIALSGILPASLLGIVGGTIYGLAVGFLLASASTMAGAVLAFLLSRSTFRPAIERLCARRPRLGNFDARIARDGWKLVCLLRLSPVMPFAPTSYLLGLSSIRMRDYLIGTLASMPTLLGFVFLGTLADGSAAAAPSGAGMWGWIAISVGATLALTAYLGRIAISLGLFGEPNNRRGFTRRGLQKQANGPQRAPACVSANEGRFWEVLRSRGPSARLSDPVHLARRARHPVPPLLGAGEPLPSRSRQGTGVNAAPADEGLGRGGTLPAGRRESGLGETAVTAASRARLNASVASVLY
jgi:uncharacterized membrane protein YdjX (TVP38/TMEM64 family)